MKFSITVTELSIGVSYFDKVDGPYCSFLAYSPNHLVVDWKEPEGEGNWLPMRAKGGGPLQGVDGDAGSDKNVDEKPAAEHSTKKTEMAEEA